jgi:pimeloyl-ACP methyl ester carboxylesterase
MVSAVAAEMAQPDQFYRRPPEDGTFNVSGNKLTYKTAFPDGTANDLVRVDIVRETQRWRAVIIIPHWNTQATSYLTMGKIISYCGFSVFIITLPHHSGRGGEANLRVANDFLNADLGATIRSVRQSVVDTRLLIGWLTQRGYSEINLIGVSLGSCVGALVAAFEPRIRRAALLLTAGDFAETVWTGRATAHIRNEIENHVTFECLQKIWSIISPINFLQNFVENAIPLMILSARRDGVVPFRSSQAFISALQRAGVPLIWRILPCGHYTLARFPFDVAALLLTLHFLCNPAGRFAEALRSRRRPPT